MIRRLSPICVLLEKASSDPTAVMVRLTYIKSPNSSPYAKILLLLQICLFSLIYSDYMKKSSSSLFYKLNHYGYFLS